MHSGMKKKILCVLLAALLTIVAVPVGGWGFPVSAASAEGSEKHTAGSLSYYAYEQQHSKENGAVPEIVLKAQQAQGGTQKEYLAEPAVQIAGEETAQWTVRVPETGLYVFWLRYVAVPGGNGKNFRVSVQVDGKTPFAGASSIQLKRLWEDDGNKRRDELGNDLAQNTREVFAWQTVALTEDSGYSASPCRWYLPAGEHTVTVAAEDMPLCLSSLRMGPAEKLRPYKEVYTEYKEKGYTEQEEACLTYQAEDTAQKSSQNIFPIYDRDSAAMVPSDPYVIRRNEIGGEYWKQNGEWISYTVEAPAAGLYCLTFKYKQAAQLDMAVCRRIEINGQVPYAEFDSLTFPYATGWQNYTPADKDGHPYYVYLHKGTNTIKMAVTTGQWSAVLQQVADTASQLSTLYRRIIMVTSTSPDNYRDYYLEREIDGLKETLANLADQLYQEAEAFDAVNGARSSQSATLRTAGDQMAAFSEKIASIPKQLSTFRENITSLADWLQNTKLQPLELDYFIVRGSKADIPSANGTFWQRFKFSFQRFIAAFYDDYGKFSQESSGSRVIDVWINEGRDQAQLWKDAITDRFTPKGIGVNVELVNVGITEAVLAGRAPDVMLGVPRGQPVNLASRNALYDLSGFPDFEETIRPFAKDAVLPYSYNGGVYALPLQQYFLMMFYRTDIFSEFSLTPPETWDAFMETAAFLQRKNLKVGLPYTAITAAGSVDLGVGAKDIFPSLLLQNGGNYYADDLKRSELDSEAALKAFKQWTSFYTDYGFDLSYDLVTLFRSGEMPLTVAGFTTAGMIDAVATEIKGNWKMALMPGTKQADGTINRAGSASGSGIIILKDAEDPQACWEFLKWVTSAETQASFANKVESLMGVSARYPTANLDAFEQLFWTEEEQKLLKEQRGYVVETPEIPGSYYTSRCVDNAFRKVVYEQANPRKALREQFTVLQTEIDRKIRELM